MRSLLLRSSIGQDTGLGAGKMGSIPIRRFGYLQIYAPVAQLVEHLTEDQGVVGSIPSGSTILYWVWHSCCPKGSCPEDEWIKSHGEYHDCSMK